MTPHPVCRVAPAWQDVIAEVPRRIFGSFVEHMGRSVYTGIYEPTHPTANELGFRQDVLELTRELGVTIVRYPGGNFVSGYRWEDGVGPRSERPRRLGTAWHEVETNEVGLHEFAEWCRSADVELMEAVNLGTRGLADAMDLVEYANHPSGTLLSDRRRRNGREDPFDIRLWCLGNEMDGPWQLGAKTAEEFGRLAHETAKGMRAVDSRLELVVPGSSGPTMPTFGEWERTVLRHTYADVDFVSLHLYVQERPGRLAEFLASAELLDGFIGTVVDIVDEVKRDGGHTNTVHLAVDEWNVWNQDRFNDEDYQRSLLGGPWLEHPPQIEDVYTQTDAIVVATMLHTLLRRSDRVKIANQAQLVNVIAPIMTVPGGPAWRQTIFWPFARMARLARGAVVPVAVQSPAFVVEGTQAPMIDAVATLDATSGRAAVFAANRSLDDTFEVVVELPTSNSRWAPGAAEALVAPDGDRLAVNSADDPDRVRLTPLSVESDGMTARLVLPPLSWGCLPLHHTAPQETP